MTKRSRREGLEELIRLATQAIEWGDDFRGVGECLLEITKLAALLQWGTAEDGRLEEDDVI